jgi:hypothetical protein
VDDALRVRVLHRLADLREQREPLADRQGVRVAEAGDRLALHMLHREAGPALLRESAVEHLGDVGMVHHRQRLALLLESRDHLLRVKAEAHDLERDALDERLAPFRKPHLAETAFAERRDEPVRADGPPARAASSCPSVLKDPGASASRPSPPRESIASSGASAPLEMKAL